MSVSRKHIEKIIAVLAKVGFAVFAPLTPQTKPHSKKTANAVHLLFANAHAQDNVSELIEKDFIFAVIQNKFTTFAFVIF